MWPTLQFYRVSTSIFSSEFDLSFLTDDQKRRVLEFWKLLFQQQQDQGSRKRCKLEITNVNPVWINHMFWNSAQRTQQQNHPPCLGNIRLRSGFQRCQKHLPSLWFGGFPCCYDIAAKCAKNQVICCGWRFVQLLSRHEGWGSFFFKKKNATWRTVWGCVAAVWRLEKLSGWQKLCWRTVFLVRIQVTYFTAGRFRILKVIGHPATN